jgi:hypothetical protein
MSDPSGIKALRPFLRGDFITGAPSHLAIAFWLNSAILNNCLAPGSRERFLECMLQHWLRQCSDQSLKVDSYLGLRIRSVESGALRVSVISPRSGPGQIYPSLPLPLPPAGPSLHARLDGVCTNCTRFSCWRYLIRVCLSRLGFVRRGDQGWRPARLLRRELPRGSG